MWARAVRGTLASYQRDVEATMPWAHDIEALLAALSDAPQENVVALRSLAASPATLAELRERGAAAAAELRTFGGARGRTLLETAIANLERSLAASDALIDRLSAVAAATKDLFETMQFDFLFDPTRKIFSIGYRVTDGSLDPSGYDLLASEARLASFIAIAKGDVPVSHWFRLGRPMTPVALGAALVSWSGSMFEYLMPALVMKAPLGSLLEQTYRFVVRRQMSYGADHGVPWGISESAYNVRDLDLTYQYSNFGIPGLGLERGLSEDLVVAPYATALAAMVDPLAAARNFARLVDVGARGPYGFYEALDYTRSRRPEGEPVAIVRAYMAHHQGMTLVALVNVLRDGLMRERFHAEPVIQATELLLQERAPRDVAVARPRVEEVEAPAHEREFVAPVVSPVQFAARGEASDAPPLERAVLRDADDRGLRLQPVRQPRRHSLAGRHHARSLGDVRLPARRPERGGVVGRVSAHGCRTGLVPRHLLRGPGGDPATGRHDHDHARRARLARGRRRDAPRLPHEPRHADSRDRAHVLRRARAGAARRGRRPSGVLEPVRPDRGDRRARRPSGHAPARRRGADRLGGPRRGRGRSAGGRGPVRDRPGALPGAGTGHPDPDGRHRRPAPVEHGRPRARPDLQPPTPCSPGARARPCASCSPRSWPRRATPRSPRRHVSRPGYVRARSHVGVDAGASPVPSPRHQPGGGPPLPGAGQATAVLGPDVARPPGGADAQPPGAAALWATGSPATCRSSSSGSTRPRIEESSASFPPTSTGA